MTTDKTSTAPVMSLKKVRDQIYAFATAQDRDKGLANYYVEMNVLVMDDWWQGIDAHLNAPTPDVVGGDVVAFRFIRADGHKYTWVDASEMARNGRPEDVLAEGERIEYAYAAPRVQGDTEVTPLTDEVGEPIVQKLDKALSDLSSAVEDIETGKHQSAILSFLRGVKEYVADAREDIVALAAQPKGDALVRYCPECSSIGDVPPGARDCCPDGTAARLIPRHIAHAAHRDFHYSLQARPAEQTRSDGVARIEANFGFGEIAITTGHHGGRPCVYLAPAQSGRHNVGDPVNNADEGLPPNAMREDESVLTFPTVEQAEQVMLALAGQLQLLPKPEKAVGDGVDKPPQIPFAVASAIFHGDNSDPMQATPNPECNALVKQIDLDSWSAISRFVHSLQSGEPHAAPRQAVPDELIADLRKFHEETEACDEFDLSNEATAALLAANLIEGNHFVLTAKGEAMLAAAPSASTGETP